MLRGSVEEIVLRYHQIADDAIHDLKEDSEIEGLLTEVSRRVSDLHAQEPSFWELRVMKSIHTHLHSKLHTYLRASEQHATENGHDDVVRSVQDDIRKWLEEELDQLQSILQHPNQGDDISDAHDKQGHFADVFWRHATARLESSVEDTPETIETTSDMEAPTEQPSYEAISIDDLQFDGNSVDSGPGLDEIPSLLESLSAENPKDRRSALQQLSQVAALEITHSIALFSDIVLALARCFADTDPTIARDSVRLLYDILNHVEEPQQFLEVYLTVLDCVGVHLQAGTLQLRVNDVFSNDEQAVAAIDVFRLLHEMISRVPHHWIHFPMEKLATVICGTLVLLILDLPAQDSKTCRVIDVFAVLDPTASWCNKWILKVPSRGQLCVSMDETGFLSELLHCMTRVRPFEEDVDAIELAKTTSFLSILTVIGRCSRGRESIMQWTKLPAHSYNTRRYQEWRGLPAQFRLEVAAQENERVFHFVRTDREVADSSSLELEDTEPLGELGLVSIVLASTVLYLCRPRSTPESHTTLQLIALQSFDILSPSIQIHQEFLRRMLELCASGLQLPPPLSSPPENDIEELDSWLPFRRPRAMATIFPQIFDTIVKRDTRGLLSREETERLCEALLVGTIECAARLPSLESATATALAKSLHVYLDRSLDTQAASSTIILKLLPLAQQAQFSVANSLSEGTTSVFHLIAHCHNSLSHDDPSRAMVGEFVVGMAHSAAAIQSLHASGLWAAGVHFSLDKWRRTGSWDVRALHLLSMPAAADAVARSSMVESSLRLLIDASVDHLDVALALNSSPSDAPFSLRQVASTIASLRSILGTQYAAQVLSDRDASWTHFLEEAVQRHSSSQCQSTPQAEDRCTMAFDMVTALTGCVPSMVRWFDLLSRHQLADFSGRFEDDSFSACSSLAMNIASSSAHVGGLLSDWDRPHPVYCFDPHNQQPRSQVQGESESTKATAFKLTPHMSSTVDQMIESIQHSKRRDDPLDVVMLSQATWELIGDIEKAHATAPTIGGHLALTKIVAGLVYELAMSGQCKLTKAYQRKASPSSDQLPSDAERKLLNRYYKDYCARSGLKASPTLLHVLFKTFGRAASDCFPVTVLMVLDQVYSEDEIVALLEYCASCRFISFLWPRVKGDGTELPVLLPLAYAVEMILEEEYPQILTTLRSCNCSVLSLVLRWHSQYYWNFLTWDNILLMLHLNFLYGAEFQVYLAVAIIKYMAPTIETIHAANLDDPSRAFVEIHQAPIIGFRFYPWRTLFLRWRSTYHDRIQALDAW